MGKRDQKVWVAALLIPSVAAVVLWCIRFIATGSWWYFFLNWNLVLAWAPLLCAFVFAQRHARDRKLDGWGGLLLMAWLAFLPNSFYLLTDFIHLQRIDNNHLMFDIAMLGLFAFNGMALGLIATFIVHHTLAKKVSLRAQVTVVAVLAFLIGFAVYLGRYLRWNSWDVLVNPAGILFDVSDRFINPSSYPRTFSTTLLFAFLFLALYLPVWLLAERYRLKQR